MHQRSHLLAVLLCAFVCSAAASPGDEFVILPFDAQLSRYIHTYRTAPDPQKALDRLLAIDMDEFEERGKAPEYGTSRAILMAFFSHVLHEHPELVLPFARTVGENTRGRLAAFCAEAVAVGASADRDEALALIGASFELSNEHLSRLRALPTFPYPHLAAENWELLDILWASYYASGDVQYVSKIAGALEHFIPPDEKLRDRIQYFSSRNAAAATPEHQAYVQLLTAQAAASGLRSNASHDETVLRLLQELAATLGSTAEAAKWNLDHLSLRSYFVDQ